MQRKFAPVLAVLFLAAEICAPLTAMAAEEQLPVLEAELFDAMQDGVVEAKFVARNPYEGRLVLTNKTKQPLSIELPDAFIAVPVLQQRGGGGFGGGGGGFGGGGGGLGGGGQQQTGGGFGGGGGGGRGGRGGGGRGGGRFNIAPESIDRIDVATLCLNHGLRDPSSSKPYAIRPIENYIQDPAVIELIRGYGYGELPTGAAQAAVWHMNSQVSWQELGSKLTGTARSFVREPYFSRAEMHAAVAMVDRARQLSAGVIVEPRPFDLDRAESKTSAGELAEGSRQAEEAKAAEESATESDAEDAEEKAEATDKAPEGSEDSDAAADDQDAVEDDGAAKVADA